MKQCPYCNSKLYMDIDIETDIHYLCYHCKDLTIIIDSNNVNLIRLICFRDEESLLQVILSIRENITYIYPYRSKSIVIDYLLDINPQNYLDKINLILTFQ